ncbi:helix-turn-helix domain-containing protein [Cereibacter sphaeroides]|uniref:helix-turn-helix domain-containing protein n=1 Tax=Cereibacter sphaeroides TaxID=1063 RepID=UPI001F25F7D9|nr:helix-turn-helix domain-containing protein [Cereibacter sphaeroides]MCE6952404.1 helix-turn-helix domain-containing protein [Cereibacter sphaeroides]
MSIAGVEWATAQTSVGLATRMVLVAIARYHNSKTGACFPSQERLCDDLRIGRSQLNAHLSNLEAVGLIRRETRLHRATGQRLSTQYHLALSASDPVPADARFEPVVAAEPQKSAPSAHVRDLGHGGEIPRPVSRQPMSGIPDTNKEKNLKEEERREAGTENAFFEELLRALGIGLGTSLPSWWRGRGAKEHVAGWVTQLGLTETEIIEEAAASRLYHPVPPDGPKALDRAMERRARRKQDLLRKPRWERMPVPKAPRTQAPAPAPDRLTFYAEKVNGPGFLPPSMINNTLAAELLSSGLVTASRLRDRGVPVPFVAAPSAPKREPLRVQA